MNKKSFRVIFSKTLQRLVVVSELAKSEGKGSEASASSTSGPISSIFCKIRPLTFSLFCALGFVSFSENALAELVIQADKSAPKHAQPIVLKTANGLPQVNIQTPNDKGLSHNKYSKFDVDTKGAILNNSRTQTQTQQAGMIQGNPYLARGEAKVILNEVNSNDPSVLKGYVEVAGKKADVIIANPSGLHCEGCGIINSDRVTLTTGKPQIKQGNLDSFVVEKGKVKVSGKGLDNSRVDYTDIIAKETEINAGVWSKQKLTTVTGKNTVKARTAADSDSDLQIINTAKQSAQTPATNAAPQYALDISELGGMYSGKVHLIGTEQGLGVRNAGHIGASSENIKIDSQGRIVNQGLMSGENQAELSAKQGIENHGKLETKQGNIVLTSQADIQQHGSIVARQGNIQQRAVNGIRQSGETVAKGKISFDADHIEASESSLIAAGVDIQSSKQGETRQLSAQADNGKDIHITTRQQAVLNGKNIASGTLQIKADRADLNKSQTSANRIDVHAKTGDIQANQAKLSAKETLRLNTPKTLSTESSHVSAKRIQTTQTDLNTRNAVWEQTGEQDFALKAQTINNQGGAIKTQGKFTVRAEQLDNTKGRLVSNAEMDIKTQALNNKLGYLVSNQTQTVNSQQLTNQQGVIASQNSSVDLSVSSLLNNQQGTISAKNQLNLTAYGVDNKQGTLYTAQDNLVLDAQKQALNNQQGQILSGKALQIDSAEINNQKGTFFSTENQQINTNGQQLTNTQDGKIQSLAQLIINTALLDNQGGFIQTQQGGTITASHILNNKVTENGSLIEAGAPLVVNTPTFENNGTVAQDKTPTQGIIAQKLTLTSDRLENEKGGIYLESEGLLNIAKVVNNQAGEILSWGDLVVLGNKSLIVHNREGKLQATNNFTVTAKSLSGDGYLQAKNIAINLQDNFDIQQDINAKHSLSISTEGDILNRKKLAANDRLQLNARNITNEQNARISSAETRLNAKATVHNEGLINSRSDNGLSKTVIKAEKIENIGTGRIYGDHVALGAEQILNQDKDGKSATIAARKRLDLAAKEIENGTKTYELNKKDGSLIYSEGDIAIGRHLDEQDTVIGNAEHLKNLSSVMEAAGDIYLNVNKINNDNIHYSSKLEITDTQKVKEHFIIPRSKHNRGGEKVFNDGHNEKINVNDLTKGYYRKTWSYWQKYNEDSLPVITDASQITESTVLAKPYALKCVDQNMADCIALPAGIYNKDNPVWNKFGIQAPDVDQPEMTPEIVRAMNEEDQATKHLSEEQLDKLTQDQQNGIAPIVPTKPVKPVKLATESDAEYQKRVKAYQAELKTYEAADAAYKRYILLKPFIDWEAKYGDRVQLLDNAIAEHNKRILNQEYAHFWNLWINEKVVKENITQTSLPAQILAGGTINYQSDEFINDKSWVIAGNGLNQIGSGKIANLDDKDAVRQDWELGTREFSFTRWRGGTKRRHSRYDEEEGKLARLKEVHKDMNIFVELANTIPSNYKGYVDAKSLNQVKDEGNSVNITSNEGEYRSGIQIVNPNQEGPTSQDGIEIRSIKADTRLPNQSLYKINPDADSHVLIETDPDFTDRKRWLASDYMYNALRSEHEAVHKRLGDGFYEQRLVREQINKLTGRQFLGEFENFEAQYKALMDAGITFAQKFNLRPGISLSSNQVAQLTSDIVWLETESVTLPNGQVEQVLVPKVYAVARKGDISGKGSLISADKVNVNPTSLINEGTIAGRNFVKFAADKLVNSGKISGGILQGNVSGDAENNGGVMEANSALFLDVAGNFTHSSTTRDTEIDLDGFKRKQTTLDRKALLHVKDANGTLQVTANNITLNGSDIINDGQGLTYLKAKDQMHLGTVAVGFDEKMGGGNHYRNEAVQDVVVSRVSGNGNVTLVANTLTAEGAELGAKERLAALAENDLVLGTALRSGEYEEYHKYKKRNAFGSSSLETEKTRDVTSHKGSVLAAKDVYLDSRKGNLDLTAAEIVALNDITAFAEKDIVLGAAENTETKSEKEIRKSSGLSASKSRGVASVGYSKNKSDMRDKNVATSIATTVLNSVSGNLTISSIHGDVTSNAARMNAGRDIAIEGNNVHLNAMTEHENNQFSYKSKSTGFGVSAVYNPVQVVKDNFGEQASQGSAAGVIGKILTAADAASKTANQLMNPGSPYFKTQKSELNKNTQKETAVIGHVNAGGNLSITAREGDITSQGSQLSAKGDGSLSAKEDIQLDVATSSTSQNNRSTRKGIELNASKGGGIYSEKDLGEGDTVTEQASVLSFGGNSSVTAKQGDVRLAGTQLVSEGDNRISAGGDVVLTTAEKRVGQSTSSKKHHIGEAVVSETEHFSGYHRQLSSDSHDSVSHSGATIASLNGNVDIEAGNDFHQTSGQILAKKRVDIEAEKVTFDVAHNTGTSSSHKSDLKMGTFARVGSPIIDLVQAVESAIENKEANDRVRAAQALGVAAKGYSTYANAAAGGALLRVEAGTGYSHSRERMESTQSEAQGNVVNAQHISVKSRSGDIQAKQTDFVSRDSEGNRLADSSITLDAHKDLIVESSQSTAKQKGKQQSSGFEVGAGVAVGAQTGAYIYVQGGFTKGKQDEQHVVQNNSHLDSETITLKSGGDTTLSGAVAKGKTINADVGGTLTVESRQDEHHSKSSSVGAGGRVQVALGTVWGGSGYGNASSGKSNSKQVVEQSGLFAEEGGYHVNADHVQLNGGAIASTNPNKSELSTNTLAFKDIENESESKALTGGMSVSANLNKLGNAEAASKEGAKQQADLAKLTGTTQSNGIKPTVPMYDSESDSSVTKATLTEGKITLNKDSQPTETTAQALGLNTDLNQANKQVEATFDIKQKLKDQQVLSAAVGDMLGAVDSYSERKQKAALEEVNAAEEALAKARRTGASQEDLSQMERVYTEAKAKEESWREGGASKRKLDTVAVTLGAILSGGSAGEVAATAISPELNAQIHKYTSDNKTANLLAHAALSALEAGISGNNALAGAASGMAGEASAMLLSEVVFNKEASQLSEEERELLSVAGQLSGALVGNGMGGNTAATLQGIETAKRAVENNYLFINEAKEKMVLQRKKVEGTATKDDLARLEEINRIDEKRNQEIRDACKQVSSEQCLSLARTAQYAQRGYEEYFSYRGQLKDIFPNDFANVEQILRGKDADSVYIEKVALGIAKAENIPLEAAKSKVENLMLFKNFAELVGSIRGATSAKYGAKVTGVPANYPKVVFNGIELHPNLPEPKAGYGFVPQKAKGNSVYQEWKDINGYRGEINLANSIQETPNRQVIKWGNSTGTNGSDVISVNTKTGEVELWDNKYRSGSVTGKISPTFDKEKTRASAIEEAIREIRGSKFIAPEIQQKALDNLAKQNFTTYTVGSGKVKNSVIQKYCSNQKCP
ncbi:hemagglutinin repeat-containing protein [Actinobacillus equuli]|uniref:two-partner secretion domain-containing protein n=1 Tax=Actinobacillus equuli TaxID=718 RepID=UPI002418658A|nr:hemagglutinin repeat-containing protein [Actinobacillus equuli]MDG4952736.1 hemagglutinin repeat-containing protein [Actinobacillus equuli subsp. equuli]